MRRSVVGEEGALTLRGAVVLELLLEVAAEALQAMHDPDRMRFALPAPRGTACVHSMVAEARALRAIEIANYRSGMDRSRRLLAAEALAAQMEGEEALIVRGLEVPLMAAVVVAGLAG